MLNKMAVVGAVVAVAGLGIGSAAWAGSSPAAPHSVGASVGASAQGAFVSADAALTTASTTPTAPKSDNTGKHDRAGKAHERADKARDRNHGKHRAFGKRLGHLSHAQWVSKDPKTGAFVTHNAVRGSVTAVSPTSITVKAADGISKTFAVNSGTKVRVQGAEKAATSTLSQVKVGDRVGMLGTGTGPMTATHIADRGVATAPKAPTSSAAPTT